MAASGSQLFLVNGLIKNYFKEKSYLELVILACFVRNTTNNHN